MPPHGYRSIEASQRAHVNLEKVTAASTTTRSTKQIPFLTKLNLSIMLVKVLNKEFQKYV